MRSFVTLPRELFSDPGRVHEILHYGKYFTVPGYHLSEPSPQRTPVLYQAGASRRGKDFAARNAECVFVAARPRKFSRSTFEIFVSAPRASVEIPLVSSFLTCLP